MAEKKPEKKAKSDPKTNHEAEIDPNQYKKPIGPVKPGGKV